MPDPGHEGERLDAHMSLNAGTGAPTSKSSIGLYILFGFAGLYAVYLSSASFKRSVDGLFGRAPKEEGSDQA